MKGVDISHYQKGLEVGRLKESDYEFMIIKLTEGTWLMDSTAFGFYYEAYNRAFPVGCYCYSHAVTPDAARMEAVFLLGTLRGFPMPCGIFMDVEAPEMLELPANELREVVDSWCNSIREAGYIPGVYGSEYNLWIKLNPNELPEDVLIWVAHYGKEPDVPCDLWQSSDSGSAPGYTGRVDTDVVRSERYKKIVQLAHSYMPSPGDPGPQGEPGVTDPASAPVAADPRIAVLELLMANDGFYTGELDGKYTAEFRSAFREYARIFLGEKEIGGS